MTVADLIKILLEFDQQCVSPRPSAWGKAAETVWELTCQATGQTHLRLGNDVKLGDWKSVDLSPVRKPFTGVASQPTIDRIGRPGKLSEQVRAALLERARDLFNTLVHPGVDGPRRAEMEQELFAAVRALSA